MFNLGFDVSFTVSPYVSGGVAAVLAFAIIDGAAIVATFVGILMTTSSLIKSRSMGDAGFAASPYAAQPVNSTSKDFALPNYPDAPEVNNV